MRLASVLMALACAGCFGPDYGNGTLRCTDDDRCPQGYHCAEPQHTCWRDGTNPPLPDLGVFGTPVWISSGGGSGMGMGSGSSGMQLNLTIGGAETVGTSMQNGASCSFGNLASDTYP